MHLVDEIFRDFKEKGYIDDLKRIDNLSDRLTLIATATKHVNVFKAELQDLSSEEQLYLDYKLQAEGINLNLCPYFYIFFSNKNNKFHHVCKKDGEMRAYCKGKIEKCDKNIKIK